MQPQLSDIPGRLARKSHEVSCKLQYQPCSPNVKTLLGLGSRCDHTISDRRTCITVHMFPYEQCSTWNTSHSCLLMPEFSSLMVLSAQAMRGVLWAMPRRPRASSKIIPPCPFTRACK